MSLYKEIHSQPEILQKSYEHNLENVKAIGKALRGRNIQYAFMAARGTSDNAARYANYLWGAYNHLPVALATPSLFSIYQQPVKSGHLLRLSAETGTKRDEFIRQFSLQLEIAQDLQALATDFRNQAGATGTGGAIRTLFAKGSGQNSDA